MPSVERAVYVRPVFTDSDSTPPCPKNHGLSTNTTSWPASGEYVLQPTVQNANRIRSSKLLWFTVPPSFRKAHHFSFIDAGMIAQFDCCDCGLLDFSVAKPGWVLTNEAVSKGGATLVRSLLTGVSRFRGPESSSSQKIGEWRPRYGQRAQ